MKTAEIGQGKIHTKTAETGLEMIHMMKTAETGLEKIHMTKILEIVGERKSNSSKHQYCKAGHPWCRHSSYLLVAASHHEFEFDSLDHRVESTVAILPIDHTGIQSHHYRRTECCTAACR
jgi:hypothetical protein